MRPDGQNGQWSVLTLGELSEAAPLINARDEIVLGLPATSVLTQRFRLPTVDPAEFSEMVRIQLEKALPFSLDEVTSDFEVIEQNDNESVIAAAAVRNEQLSELAAPLLERGLIPRQVTIYAAQRASTYAPSGNALLIYPEGETLVSAVAENGKVSLTRTLDGGDAEAQLRTELPQFAISVQLQGITGAFPNVLLDETCYRLRDTVEDLVGQKPEMVSIETPPAPVKLNLVPESWKQRRAQLSRRSEWRKRLFWVGGAYAGVFALMAVYLIGMRALIGYFNSAVSRDAGQTQFVRTTDANWKALGPAIDPRYYPVEILLHLFESLPSPEVRITTYNQSARQISIEGEANSPALAYQFMEKIKKNGPLQIYNFNMGAPRILPNNHAQFRIEGRPR